MVSSGLYPVFVRSTFGLSFRGGALELHGYQKDEDSVIAEWYGPGRALQWAGHRISLIGGSVSICVIGFKVLQAYKCLISVESR